MIEVDTARAARNSVFSGAISTVKGSPLRSREPSDARTKASVVGRINVSIQGLSVQRELFLENLSTHSEAALTAAWSDANARLRNITARRTTGTLSAQDERDEQELLGQLDSIEGEVGRRELAKPIEQRWTT